MQSRYEVVCNLFHGFDYRAAASSPDRMLDSIAPAAGFILGIEGGKKRLLDTVGDLSKAYALASPSDEARSIRDEVAFFQAVRAFMAKATHSDLLAAEETEHAVRQLVSKAVSPAGIVDVFALAGLDKPDISILSDHFLAQVKQMPEQNLAVELLHKLLEDELQHRSRRQLVLSRSFAAMLEDALNRYRNRAIQAAEVIEQLIQIARELRAAGERGEQLNLSPSEYAFYQALGVSDSAVQVMGDEVLSGIARELTARVRASASIDWTLKASAQARIRVLVKEILRKHRYPPEKEDAAVQTVLQQAELFSSEWAHEPNQESLRERYGELVARKARSGLTLPEERELRALDTALPDEPYPLPAASPLRRVAETSGPEAASED